MAVDNRWPEGCHASPIRMLARGANRLDADVAHAHNPKVQAALDLEERARALLAGCDNEYDQPSRSVHEMGTTDRCTQPAFGTLQASLVTSALLATTSTSRTASPPAVRREISVQAVSPQMTCRATNATNTSIAQAAVPVPVPMNVFGSRCASPTPARTFLQSESQRMLPVCRSSSMCRSDSSQSVILTRVASSFADGAAASPGAGAIKPISSFVSDHGFQTFMPLSPVAACGVRPASPMPPVTRSGSCLLAAPAPLTFGRRPVQHACSPTGLYRSLSRERRGVGETGAGLTLASGIVPPWQPMMPRPELLAKIPTCDEDEQPITAQAPRALSAPFFFKPRDSPPPSARESPAVSSRSAVSEKPVCENVDGPLTKPFLQVNCQARDMVKLANGVVERGRPVLRESQWHHAQATMEWYRGRSPSPLTVATFSNPPQPCVWPRSLSPVPVRQLSPAPEAVTHVHSSTPTLDKLVGTWVYSTSDDRYSIQKTSGNQLHFQEENASGQQAYGMLLPDGPWFTAQLQARTGDTIGTIRLRFRGADTLLSNFRKWGDTNWGPDTVGQKLQSQDMCSIPIKTSEVADSANEKGALASSEAPEVPTDVIARASDKGTKTSAESSDDLALGKSDVALRLPNPEEQVPTASSTAAGCQVLASGTAATGTQGGVTSFYKEVDSRQVPKPWESLIGNGKGSDGDASAGLGAETSADRGRSPWRSSWPDMGCGTAVWSQKTDSEEKSSMPMRDFLRRAGSLPPAEGSPAGGPATSLTGACVRQQHENVYR